MNTNEFAKLCKVTKRTLIHYDEIGLLKPALTHENGYREYSLNQIYKMDTIKIFQRAGYSLTEIKKIYNLGPKEMESQLKKAEEVLRQKILELTKMSSFLKNKLELYEAYKKSGYNVVAGVYEVAEKYSVQTDKTHFFSFLHDGFNEMILLSGEQQVMLQVGEGMKAIEGYAFFLEIDSEAVDLTRLIKEKIKENNLEDPLEYHLSTIPHALIENEGKAIVRVIIGR